MQKQTLERLIKLQDEVKKEKNHLHYLVFVESHANIIPGDHENNRRELKRYQKFHESGFDSIKAIEDMVKLDFVISDLETLIYFEKMKNERN